MTAPVIGLGGRLRAGKDEVANRLVALHGFTKIGMSDALHEAMLAVDPLIPVNDVSGATVRYSRVVAEVGYVEAKTNPEVRRLLQKLGTEVGRDMIGENVWVNITARKIDNYLYADQPVVVTGIRFANETKMIRQFAGYSAWVDRPGLDSATPSAVHASENSVSAADFDHTIVNDGTLEDLYAKVDTLMEGLTL